MWDLEAVTDGSDANLGCGRQVRRLDSGEKTVRNGESTGGTGRDALVLAEWSQPPSLASDPNQLSPRGLSPGGVGALLWVAAS